MQATDKAKSRHYPLGKGFTKFLRFSMLKISLILNLVPKWFYLTDKAQFNTVSLETRYKDKMRIKNWLELGFLTFISITLGSSKVRGKETQNPSHNHHLNRSQRSRFEIIDDKLGNLLLRS